MNWLKEVIGKLIQTGSMTDLKTFVIMLSKSNESFSKEKSGDFWVVKITKRGIEFTFNKDESFYYCIKTT